MTQARPAFEASPGILIVGAGECGIRAAFALREQGHTGPVTLVGAECSLPYERPPLSKGTASGPKPIRPEAAYAETGIELRLGTRVDELDTAAKRVRLSDGTWANYDKLLLATGARARLFPGMEGCLTLRTDADATRIVRRFGTGTRVGIVGGGFIGLELAATARLAGADVTVVEAAPRLMARAVPAEIAAVVEARHRREGVDVRTGTPVASANATVITLGDGTGLDFDLVVAGVGSLPETGLAETAGLAVDDGIVVDRAFRTSAPDVHAAGDCCRFPWRGRHVRLESWRAAQDQGAHVAAAMLGGSADYVGVPWFWSDQYELTLQVAGLFDPGRETLRRASSDEAFLVFQLDDDARPIAVAGVGPGNAVAKDVRLAEKLIELEAPVDPTTLSDPSIDLKRLLKAAKGTAREAAQGAVSAVAQR